MTTGNISPARVHTHGLHAEEARTSEGVQPQTSIEATQAIPVAGAAELQMRLKTAFEHADPTAPADAQTPPATAKPATPPSQWRSKLIKAAVGLALLAAVGIMPAQRLLQVSSVEALVNARLITVRAPIDGVVSASGPALRAGAEVSTGTPLVTVSNPRADSARLDTALENLADTKAENQAKWNALLKLLDTRLDLKRQLDAFRDSRVRDIDARIAAADARIEGALAEQTRSAADLERRQRQFKRKAISRATYETAVRDAAVADAAVKVAQAERAARQVERDALDRGTFFGDDYNDEPRSAQRIDELDLQITEVESDITRLNAAVDRAAGYVEREREAVQLAGRAELRSPAKGQVWQVLTAPGEQVVAGQELYSLLDCSQAIVTAVVSEATYNTLNVGMPARFTFREGAALPGRIVHLSGVAEASSNYAIAPSSLVGDSYRVSVAIDGGSDTACQIGRTGRVVFGESGS